jgi:hypothetical protein
MNGSRLVLGGHVPVRGVEIVEQMLLDEATRMEIREVEVGVFRTEALLEVLLGMIGHLPQLPQDPPRLGRHFGETVTEDDQGDNNEDGEFSGAYVEHLFVPSQRSSQARL